MTSVDQLLKPDPPRDHWGRYLLRLPGDKKARGRTRVTTFIRALDQGDGLLAWKATATMVGALRNPGLHAKWAAIFAQSQDPWYHSDDLKAKCKKLVDECADHGGAQSRADHGTALHSMLELVARGEEPNLVDPYRADIEAFKQTLAAVPLVPHPDWTEVCVYIERYDLVGTFDGFFYGEHGPLILGDYKTVSSTEYKALSMATQLAAYSLATHRIVWSSDPDSEATLEPLPQFDHDTGLIIHLPAGEARCTLHAVDLEQGRQALEVAHTMRRLDAQRKRKDTGGLMRPWTPTTLEASCPGSPSEKTGSSSDSTGSPPTPTTPTLTPDGSSSSPNSTSTTTPKPAAGPDTPPPSEQDLKTRLREIHQHQPDLARLISRRWPVGVPAIRDPWSVSDVTAVGALLDEVDIEGPYDPDGLERVARMFDAASEDANKRVMQWVVEAASDPNRYRPLALGAGNHTTRRICLAEACLLVAGGDVDDQAFIVLIEEAMPLVFAHCPGIGHALGIFRWREAQHLLTLTRLHLNLHTTIESSQP